MKRKPLARLTNFQSDNRQAAPRTKSSPADQKQPRRPKWAGVLAILVLLVGCVGMAHAQQTGKILRIGFLDVSTASGMAVLVDAFRQELSKLGWVEGKNIAIEYRFAEQKSERLPDELLARANKVIQ